MVTIVGPSKAARRFELVVVEGVDSGRSSASVTGGASPSGMSTSRAVARVTEVLVNQSLVAATGLEQRAPGLRFANQ